MCGMVGSEVDTLFLLFRRVCSVELLVDVIGMGWTEVRFEIVLDTESGRQVNTCEHLVVGITDCSGASTICLMRFSGRRIVLVLV